MPYLILALILPIVLIAPLFYPGYFETHSGFLPLWYLTDTSSKVSLLEWESVDRLTGQGMLPYVIATILPFSPATSIKVLVGLGWLMGSIGMVLWLKSWLGYPGAFISAIVYSYLPHHIATMYIRGDWVESLFWSLLPWAILSTTFFMSHPSYSVFIIATIAWVLLGLTQLGLTLWALAFFMAMLMVIHTRQATRPILAATIGTTIAIGLTFLFAPYPTFSPPNFNDHLLYPFQLVSAQWGHGVSQAGVLDSYPFQLGLAACGLTFVTLYLWPRSPQANRVESRLIFFVGAAIVLSGLQLEVARPLWQLPGLAQTLTYPWQLTGFVGLCLAVLAGAIPWLDENLSHLPSLGAITLFAMISSYPYIAPQFIRAEAIPTEITGVYGQHIVLLNPTFEVQISGQTAGLESSTTTIPLSLHGALQPHDILWLHLTWQALQPLTQDWKLFIHLVASEGQIIAQFDGYPQYSSPSADSNRTSRWISGALITDSYPLIIPADAPSGPYQLYIGFYDENTLNRLPVTTDSAGRVILNVE